MSALMRVLNELRMMRRNISLRKENDPAKVISVLETIIKESVLIRGVDTDSVIAKGVLEELSNIRNGLLMNRINAGPMQNNMIAKLTMILGELQTTKEKLEEEFGSGEDEGIDKKLMRSAFEKITENIPSASAITSALISANPLIGYSAKIILDFNQSRREYKQRTKEEAQRRSEILKSQAEEIKRKLDNLALEEEILKNKKDEPKESESINEPESITDDSEENIDGLEVSGIETLEAILEDIYEEMKQLNAVWQGDSNTEKDALPITDKEEVFMEDVVKKLDDVDNGIKNESKLANLRRREEEIAERVKFIETRDMQSASPVTNISDSTKSLGGINILGGVNGAGRAGLLAGIGGVIGSIAAAVISPIISFFKFLNPLSGLLSKTVQVGKVSGFIGAMFGAFNFIESFINAEDILEKDALDITWWDRILTGFAGFFVGITEPFNMLSKWLFDYDFLGDKNEKIKQLFDLYDAYWEGVFALGDYLWDGLQGFLEKVPSYIDNLFTSVENFFNETLPAFGAYLTELPPKLWNSFETFVTDFVEDLFDFIKEVVFGSIRALKEKATDMKEGLFDFFDFWGNEEKTNEDVANYANRIMMNDGTNEGISKYIGDLLGTVEDRNIGVRIDDSVLGDMFYNQTKQLDSLNSDTINTPARSTLENRMNQMEEKLQSTSTVNNVNVSPIVNNSSTNIRNNTVSGNGLSTLNNEPSYRRYTSRSGELLYR